jgi:hypothetical protein
VGVVIESRQIGYQPVNASRFMNLLGEANGAWNTILVEALHTPGNSQSGMSCPTGVALMGSRADRHRRATIYALPEFEKISVIQYRPYFPQPTIPEPKIQLLVLVSYMPSCLQ